MSGVRIDAGPGGDWCYLTVNRPEVRNALDPQTLSELNEAIASVAEGVRLVVIRGAGSKSFLSGADIASMLAMSPSAAAEFVAAGHRVCRSLERHPAVIGALVDGYALGGGTEIALACDVVVATQQAVFGLPEVRLGIFPGWGGTQRLVRVASYQQAMRYLLTGSQFGGDEAYRLGVATAVVDTTSDAEKWFAALVEELRAASPRSVAAAKRVSRDGMGMDIDRALGVESDAWMTQFVSADRTEGMQAFLEKRPARWGRPV